METASDSRTDRLGHPFIAEIAERAVKRKKGRARSREESRLAVMRSRVKSKLKGIAGMTRIAGSAHAVEAITRWLDEHALFVNEDNVRAAADAVAGLPRVVSFGGEPETR